MDFFLLLIGVSLIWHGTNAECAVPNFSKTRRFDSVLQFRNNQIPFSPVRTNWRGSNVEFTFDSLENLQKDTFKTYDSGSIIALNLTGKQIRSVESGAFSPLVCLNKLDLSHNRISKISRSSFRGVEKLKQLDLSHNRLQIIKNSTFENLVRLKILDLSYNQIKIVETSAFTDLNLLEFLNLERNQIALLEEHHFQPLTNLQSLILSWNQLEEIHPEKWSLSQLENLQLAANNLRNFDPFELSFPNLKELNLSYNFLTRLDIAELKRHLPKLEVLDLNNNLWFCDNLEFILQELNDSKISCPGVGLPGSACLFQKCLVGVLLTLVVVLVVSISQKWTL